MSTPKIDMEKLVGLPTANSLLNEKYGEHGTPTREDFSMRAKAWYFAELFREKRREKKITQTELANRIGKKREYIALLEKGKTDMQLSTFLSISDALGMQIELTE